MTKEKLDKRIEILGALALETFPKGRHEVGDDLIVKVDETSCYIKYNCLSIWVHYYSCETPQDVTVSFSLEGLENLPKWSQIAILVDGATDQIFEDSFRRIASRLSHNH